MTPLVSHNPELTAVWAAECLRLRLYRDDGVARFVFDHEAPIHRMAYLPEVGWAMEHGWPDRFAKTATTPGCSVYVRPEDRRRGLASMLCRAIGTVWFGELKKRLASKERQ